MKNVTALYISISIISLVSGCAPIGVYSTSTGHGSSSPVHREHSSSAETYTCMDVRDAQDDETTEEAFSLLARVGLIPSTREVTVNYRDATRVLCDQSDARETAGESRTITRAECERLLAADGIPADATGTVTSTERASVDPRVEAMILPIAQARLYFGLFMADAQRYCQDREMSTVLFAGSMPAGGFSTFAPIGAAAGMGYFGGLGGGTGFGLGTSGGATATTMHARGDIVVNSYNMRIDAIAVVSIDGSGPMQINPGVMDRHYRGAAGVATHFVTVDCMINGVTVPHMHRELDFGLDGGNVELRVLCGG